MTNALEAAHDYTRRGWGKLCSRCAETKARDQFRPHHGRCIPCNNTIDRERRREARGVNHDRTCAICEAVFRPLRNHPAVRYCSKQCKHRAGQIKRCGITIARFKELTVEQEGRCAICRLPPQGINGLHIDHHHASGRVRALLCDGCNPGLGNFRESPARLRAAADYLERHAL